TLLSVVFFLFNLFMAETERPQLLRRQFSRDYIVKFLGLNAFTVYDAITTYQTNQVRAEASANDMKQVEDYVKQQYAAADDSKFGIAKGK
ncbi:LTA synthase family protein, partial [Enterococcus faecalis]